MPYKNKQEQKEAQHKSYLRNKSTYKVRNQMRRKERRIWFDNIISDFFCIKCGENDSSCLDFHHTNPNEKDDNVSRLLNELRSKNRVLKEIKKCVCLCSNCHRKFHAGKLKLS